LASTIDTPLELTIVEQDFRPIAANHRAKPMALPFVVFLKDIQPQEFESTLDQFCNGWGHLLMPPKLDGEHEGAFLPRDVLDSDAKRRAMKSVETCQLTGPRPTDLVESLVKEVVAATDPLKTPTSSAEFEFWEKIDEAQLDQASQRDKVPLRWKRTEWAAVKNRGIFQWHDEGLRVVFSPALAIYEDVWAFLEILEGALIVA